MSVSSRKSDDSPAVDAAPNMELVSPEYSALGDDNSDGDSALGDDISNYTETVRSSVYDYREEWGRKYHRFEEGRYALPSDDKELERLDAHHLLIMRAMQDQLYFAPIPSDFAGRVLDIGTGTGAWCIEFADRHPASVVIGNDLAPTQPSMVPPNVQFYIDDVEKIPWNYSPQESFDYIHARFLAGAIKGWPQMIDQCFQHIKPGGHIELQDWNTWLYSQDNSLPADSSLNKFHQITCGGRHSQGFDMQPGVSLEKWLKDAGFVDVEVTKIALPLGPWPKDKHLKLLGAINLVQMELAVEGICYGVLPSLPPEAGGPWSWEEIQVFLAQIRKDMRNRRLHSLYDFYVVHGRKPS